MLEPRHRTGFPAGTSVGVMSSASWRGARIEPESLALASSDGHPRASSYTSWIPLPTVRAVRRHAFYARLAAAQTGSPSASRQAGLARADPQRMNVGWVLGLARQPRGPLLPAADGLPLRLPGRRVSVYRPDGIGRGPP
jgi:hypothetical protein